MTYTRANRRKCDLRAHIVLACKHRRPVLEGIVGETVLRSVRKLAAARGWDVMAAERERDHAHVLLRYDATERVCGVVGAIKQRTTWDAWLAHGGELRRTYWNGRILWSDGYFACSVGDASAGTIERYIENQG